MHIRNNFQYKNKKLIELMSKNQVLVTQDRGVTSLDMMPRVSLLEDISFRKALPKSFKLYRRVVPFGDGMNKIKDSRKFMRQISSDMLSTAISREVRFFAERGDDDESPIKLQVNEGKIDTSRRGSKSPSPPGSPRSFSSDSNMLEQPPSTVFQKGPPLKPRAPFTADLIESDSLHAGGSIVLKGKERQRIFGQEGLKFPDELRLYKFLNEMTG